MNVTRNAFSRPFGRIFGSLAALLVLSVLSFAQAHAQTPAPQVHIKNFGQMDERFYRGSQPKPEDYKTLAALGIKTVIDLQAEPTEYEKREVEAAGMRYVNIPMIEKKYPREEQVEQFLKLANDPATGKFFVHCAGGRHRTGVMGAVYRFNHDGWDYDRVYREMKEYDFYTSWGHGDFKKFVQDYWERIQAQRAQVPMHAHAATATH